MSEKTVTYESHDRIAVITINRPDKLNAISADVERDLREAWLRLGASDDRVAILTGAGDRAFSAGADLRQPPELWRCMPGVGVPVDKPLIAAINGICIGGAVCLVQFCDLAVMSETARFSYPEAKVGICGGLISSLAARIPHKMAMELLLLGEEMGAQRAYEIGMVNRVVPQAELMDAAMDYAQRLSVNAPLVLRMIKRFVGEVLPKGPSEQAGIARRDLELTNNSHDAQEGPAAFREKRQPNFLGA
jgi:enoyl-CoA hydratase/carnithine racemase